jgi:hypothetical protein
MRSALQGEACQGGGMSGAYLVRFPRSPGGVLRVRHTPGMSATPWRARLREPAADAMVEG